MTPEARRARFVAQSSVLIALTVIASVFAVAVADRFAPRLDLTTSGRQSLAPSTERLIESADEPVMVAASYDPARLAPEVRRSINDILDALDRSSETIEVARIEAGSAEAARELERVTDRAGAWFEPLTEKHRRVAASLEAAVDSAREAAPQINAALADHPSALIRVRASEFVEALPGEGVSGEAAERRESDFIDQSIDARRSGFVEPLGALLTAADALIEAMARSPQEIPRPIERLAAETRDELAAAALALSALEPLWPVQIENALRGTQAVIVFSERSVAAVPIEDLVTRVERTGATVVAEDAIANAIAAVVDDAPPVVVLMHGEERRILTEDGSVSAAARAQFGRMIGRLESRRATILEWAPVIDSEPPAIEPVVEGTDRPVVHIVLSAPWVAGDRSARTPVALRLGALAEAVDRAMQRWGAVLVTLHPSQLPSTGTSNPLADVIAPFGIDAETGSALVRRISSPTGDAAAIQLTARAAASDHPIARVVGDLPVGVLLPTPLTIDDDESEDSSVRASPLVVVPADPRITPEPRWTEILSRRALPEPSEGPGTEYVIAAAAERTGDISLEGRAQRLVVVAAPLWFADRPFQTGQPFDDVFPGNAELFRGSLDYLAFRDDLLGLSPRAIAVPRVPNMSPGRLALLRGCVALGLPALVLLIAIGVRLLRTP